MIALTQKVLYTVNMCTVYGNNRFLVIDDNDHDGTIYIHVSHKNPSPGKQRDSLEVLGFQIFVISINFSSHLPVKSDVHMYHRVHTHIMTRAGWVYYKSIFFYV